MNISSHLVPAIVFNNSAPSSPRYLAILFDRFVPKIFLSTNPVNTNTVAIENNNGITNRHPIKTADTALKNLIVFFMLPF